VDVRRALSHGRIKEIVDPADDGRLVRHVDQILELLFLLSTVRIGEGRLVFALVDSVDGVVDGFGWRGHRVYGATQECA